MDRVPSSASGGGIRHAVDRAVGLGLSIVSGIVAAHHGSVEMTTAPGRGTTVRVTFPAPLGQTYPSENVISSHRTT